MKTWACPTYVGPLSLLFVIGLMLAVVYSVTADSVSVRIEIEQRKSITPLKIYWRKAGDGFSESQSVAANLSSWEQKIGLTFKGDSDLAQIRLDIDAPFGETIFVSELRIVRNVCALPISKWCVADLTEVNPLSVHDVEISKNQISAITTLGSDPYLIWEFPSVLNSQKRPLLLNIAKAGGFLVIFGIFFGFCFPKEVEKLIPRILRSLPVLLVYPVLVGLQDLSEPFFNGMFFERAVFLSSAILLPVVIAGQTIRRRSILGKPVRIAILFVLTCVIAIDVSFHLGVIDSWRFGSEPIEYHWQLGRSFDRNYQQSSLKYERDLAALNYDLKLSGRVLSDVATSVYLAATTKLSVVNPLPHHRIARRSVTKTDIEALCDKDSSWETIRETMARLAVDYVIINHDRENRNVVRSCSSLRTNQLIQRFEGVFKQVYKGAFLTAYKVTI